MTRLAKWAAIAALAFAVCACTPQNAPWHGDDIGGSFPALDFTLTRATDGQVVTAKDYKGKVTLLYFGYTDCPDICPTTLANMVSVLGRLGPDARNVRLLFITVDPGRDSLAVLKKYTSLFAPQIVGLRGTPDQLESLARRYRVAYSVTPAKGDTPYTVTHSSAMYVFDKQGNARLIETSLSGTPASLVDIPGTAADLARLVHEGPQSLWGKLRAVF